MRFDPTIQLARLIVVKNGKRAYDERFHSGVNIIRGVPGEGNSVGKSTIADLIFFALGGDLSKFKDEALLCDNTIAELIINGSKITVRREISQASMQPMWIFFGSISELQAVGLEGWQKFPYKRSGDRESFTQILFRAMGLPDVPAEAESNITMHQLLRLMYVDQMTPVDRIFRFENNDSALRRQAVGDLLCGNFDARIYPAQIELREKEREYDRINQEYIALTRILSLSGDAIDLNIIESRQQDARSQIVLAQQEIDILKPQRFQSDENSGIQQGIISKIKSDLDTANADIIEYNMRESELKYEIFDASLLLKEIERTLKHLNEGGIAKTSIGAISFMFCPSCFTPIADSQDEHSCKLCHSFIDPRDEKSRFARMRNELELQLKESRQLQEIRKNDLTEIRQTIQIKIANRDLLSAEYIRLNLGYLTEADTQIDHLNQNIGYLEREILEINKERLVAQKLYDLSENRSQINKAISTLKQNISAWISEKEFRQAEAYSSIKRNTAVILSRDLKTEAEFSSQSNVYFDFAEDRITVNDKSGFSASSLTILRNAFHLALHWSSCMNGSFRYPRFLLMDNIEDKGMTEARSQNFQRFILSISSEIRVDHQIIFTTSMIAPELDRPDLTIGDKYDYNNKSLKIKSAQ